MNAFELAPENSGRWVMDLPGYGFAKVSKAEQQKWARCSASTSRNEKTSSRSSC